MESDPRLTAGRTCDSARSETRTRVPVTHRRQCTEAPAGGFLSPLIPPDFVAQINLAFSALTDDDAAGAHQPDLLLQRNIAPGLFLVGSILGGARRAASLPRTVRHGFFPPLYLQRSIPPLSTAPDASLRANAAKSETRRPHLSDEAT